VHPQQVVAADVGCIDVSEHIGQSGFDDSILYRRKSPGALWVSRAGVMLQASRVADIRGGQSGIPLLW